MKKVNFIKTICAWCGTDIGINPSVSGSSDCDSHGICVDCFNAAIESLARQEDSWQALEVGPSGCHNTVDEPFVACRR